MSSSRPRRSAAQRATAAITDMADRDRDPIPENQPQQRTMSSRSSRRSGPGIASVTRGPPPSSSPASSAGGGGDGQQHMHLTVKLPSSKLRQATSSSNNSQDNKRRSSAGSVTAAGAAGKRTRGGKKSYVIESSEEEDEEEEPEEQEEEEEEEDEVDEEENDEFEGDTIEVEPRTARFTKVDDEEEEEDDDDEDEQMEDQGEEDADGNEDEMDIDAEGDEDEEDADGDIDMDVTPAPRAPAIKITKPLKPLPAPISKGRSALTANKPVTKGTAVAKPAAPKDEDDDDDDEELSELESEPEDVTVEVGNGEEEEDVDAEGEEEEMIEVDVADEDAEGEEDEELLSDEEGASRADTPDLSKLTARQRAKLGDVSHEYMKLSDEVQAKKHFTAEELSMRRAEMARRRRNLSEKRNEEVKMETINKLLKKQAPKTTRKNAALLAAGDETPDAEAQRRPDPMFIRWVNTREGSKLAVPDELLNGPVGRVFVPASSGIGGGKMVEEVS